MLGNCHDEPTWVEAAGPLTVSVEMPHFGQVIGNPVLR